MADIFLSTPSARRATADFTDPENTCPISIHALREEGDTRSPESRRWQHNFYPRPPRGGRRKRDAISFRFIEFLSTPSARRATDTFILRVFLRKISIHALREEGDTGCSSLPEPCKTFLSTPSARRATLHKKGSHTPAGISIHALREEGDACGAGATLLAFLFLSTPSARRATAKTETKSLFSNKLYNILHEFRRALIYNGSKNYPNHAK